MYKIYIGTDDIYGNFKEELIMTNSNLDDALIYYKYMRGKLKKESLDVENRNKRLYIYILGNGITLFEDTFSENEKFDLFTIDDGEYYDK